MGTGATVVFDSAVRVSENPEFIDRCRRVADALNERTQGSISIKFLLCLGTRIFGGTERLRLRAVVAWRNEVFALLTENPPDYKEQEENWRTTDLRGTAPGPFERDRMLSEDKLPGELAVILRTHLNRILKENEERVRHARETLSLLQ